MQISTKPHVFAKFSMVNLDPVFFFFHFTEYFGEPVGRVKIQETSKNVPRYHTLNRLIRDLFSNMFPFQNYEPFRPVRARGGLKRVEISWDICTRFRVICTLRSGVG